MKAFKNFLFVILVTILFSQYSSARDSLLNVNFGEKIPSKGQFDVFFEYDSTNVRKCIVSLVSNSKTFATREVNLTAGSNQSISVTLSGSSPTPVGTGYTLMVQLFDSNSIEIASYKKDVNVEAGYQGFYISEGKIYDANMNEFIMRGINNGHLWFDGWKLWRAYNALDNIAMTGSNVVRIAWNMNLTKYGGLVQNDLDKIISSSIRNKLVPIVTIMDATAPETCNKDSACLLKVAQWWTGRMQLLIKYRKYIIVNIANEWAGTSPQMWYESYQPVITTIRNAGFSGLLMIDSSTNQDPKGPILYGNDLIAFDPANNLVFSVHTYGRWSREKGEFNITATLQAVKTKQIPFVIGEFGMTVIQKWNGKTTNLTVDVNTLMSECQSLGIGYLGWQWAGDYFSIAFNNNFEAVNSYSPWGEALVNSPVYGIKASSKLATIF